MEWIYWFFCTLFRIRCAKPRLRPNVASMVPHVVREDARGLYCSRFKYHSGPCEAMRDKEIVTWQ